MAPARNLFSSDHLATPHTPEGIVWRYGVGCVDELVHHGLHRMQRHDAQRARHLIELCDVPTCDEVRRWLPHPFKELERQGLPCTVDTMRQYWHNGHLHDQTPVWVGTIIDIVGTHVCHVTNGAGRRLAALNVHHLEIAVGYAVYVHASIIAEVSHT